MGAYISRSFDNRCYLKPQNGERISKGVSTGRAGDIKRSMNQPRDTSMLCSEKAKEKLVQDTKKEQPVGLKDSEVRSILEHK